MLCEGVPPYGVGGVANHVDLISRKLVERGHEVHVLIVSTPSTTESELRRISTERGYVLHAVNIPWGFQLATGSFGYTIGVGPSLFNLGKKIGFDVVHGHGYAGSGFIFSLMLGLKLPAVQTIHGLTLSHFRDLMALNLRFRKTEGSETHPLKGFVGGIIYSSIELAAAKLATAVIALSDYEKSRCAISYRISPKKIVVIPNGVEIKSPYIRKERVRKELGIAGPAILYVGRIVEAKGVDILFSLFPKILSQFPTAKLIMVGDGPLRPALELKCRSLKIDKSLLFTGWFPHKEVSLWYSACDLFVLPSRFEGQPLTMLEAMGAGLPVVVSDLPGIREVVKDNYNGMIWKASRAEDLLNLILTLLRNRSLARSMGERNRFLIKERYSMNRVISRLENLYKVVIENWT